MNGRSHLAILPATFGLALMVGCAAKAEGPSPAELAAQRAESAASRAEAAADNADRAAQRAEAAAEKAEAVFKKTVLK